MNFCLLCFPHTVFAFLRFLSECTPMLGNQLHHCMVGGVSRSFGLFPAQALPTALTNVLVRAALFQNQLQCRPLEQTPALFVPRTPAASSVLVLTQASQTATTTASTPTHQSNAFHNALPPSPGLSAKHYELWNICRTFVGEACAGRDASHGLAHMETVTRQAVLIFLMNHATTATPDFIERNLSRVIVVGMLHDVNDGKYDKNGILTARVKAFLESIAPRLVGDASDAEAAPDIVDTIMQCTDAISYSKEVKRGMRWFEKTLPSAAWVVVRDSVSDSDKLEAIGYSGLLRCYEYLTHLLAVEGGPATKPLDRDEVHRLIVKHADEKLLLLKDAFIATPAGKHLAEPLHEEMVVGLMRWECSGLPSRTG